MRRRHHDCDSQGVVNELNIVISDTFIDASNNSSLLARLNIAKNDLASFIQRKDDEERCRAHKIIEQNLDECHKIVDIYQLHAPMADSEATPESSWWR